MIDILVAMANTNKAAAYFWRGAPGAFSDDNQGGLWLFRILQGLLQLDGFPRLSNSQGL